MVMLRAREVMGKVIVIGFYHVWKKIDEVHSFFLMSENHLAAPMIEKGKEKRS